MRLGGFDFEQFVPARVEPLPRDGVRHGPRHVVPRETFGYGCALAAFVMTAAPSCLASWGLSLVLFTPARQWPR